MNLLKRPFESAADAVVRACLRGRTMPAVLYPAIVWAVEMRMSQGKLPLLDETLRADIDNHAVAGPAPAVIAVQQELQPAFTARRNIWRGQFASKGH